MSEPSCEFDPIDDLADAFLERYRRGERPSLSEYTAKHPDLAERIRAVFPALVVLEEIGAKSHGPGLDVGPIGSGAPSRAVWVSSCCFAASALVGWGSCMRPSTNRSRAGWRSR